MMHHSSAGAVEKGVCMLLLIMHQPECSSAKCEKKKILPVKKK